MDRSRITERERLEQSRERLAEIPRRNFLAFVEEVKATAHGADLGSKGFGIEALDWADEDGLKLRDTLGAYLAQYPPHLHADRRADDFLLSVKGFNRPSDKRLLAVLNTLRDFEVNPTPGEYPPPTIEDLAEELEAQGAAIQSLRRTVAELERRVGAGKVGSR